MRKPLDPAIKTLYTAVATDLDQDGWFELVGWHDHALYAIDPIDKTLVWRALDGNPDDDDLFAGPGRIYVGKKEALVALDATTGAQLWSVELGDIREVHDPGDVPRAPIWVLLGNDQLFELDRHSGATRKTRAAYDSAGLFRTLVGPNFVCRDAGGLEVLRVGQPTPILSVGSDSAILHRGVIYNLTHTRGANANYAVEAYRASDGTLLARRSRTDSGILVAAVAGQPIIGDGRRLQRAIDNVRWTAPGVDPEIVEAHGVGDILVVVLRRSDAGIERHDLIGLAAATLMPVWQIEKIGYVYGALAYPDGVIVVPIGSSGSVSLVGVAPATGARLWETVVANEQGLRVGGGLVYQKRVGTAVLAATGQMIFPTDQRTAPATAPSTTQPADELPDWGIEAVAPVAQPKKNTGGRVILVIVLTLLAAALAVGIRGFF